MKKSYYIILMSSGLDSTASLLTLINEKNLNNKILIPLYIWWREEFTKVLQKEFNNCKLILEYINNKYKDKQLKIESLIKIEIPLIFYEKIRDKLKKKNKEYWCYFRNAIFIFSALNYVLNYLNFKDWKDIKDLKIVLGFIGHQADENEKFIKNIKRLINDYFKDPNTGISISNIDFYCPYINIGKTRRDFQQYFDIKKFGCWDILKYTWSCWREDETPCNNCGGCETRKSKYEKFKSYNNESIDPILK